MLRTTHSTGVRNGNVRKTIWFVGLSSLGMLCHLAPGWATPVRPQSSSNDRKQLPESPAIDRQSPSCTATLQMTPPERIEANYGARQGKQPQPEALAADRRSPSCIPPQIAPPQSIAADGGNTDDDAMAQVRSVAELSDVQPTDWAYQALQALAERYGVAIGYPDRTFRGNQPLTRDEFAAALARVLDEISQQLALGREQAAQLQEDFATAQRLQESYGTIAKSTRSRLDDLDQTVATLERNQLSTTSKLTGQTILVPTDGTNARTTVLTRIRLNLQTSFAPNTLLLTQLEAGNNGNDAIGRVQSRSPNLLGTLGLLADGGGLTYVGVNNAVHLNKLYYSFQPAPEFTVVVGARLSPRDFIDYNRFANDFDGDPTKNFSSSFFTNNPLIVQNQIDQPGGAGAVLTWKSASLPLAVRALYVAADAERPDRQITKGGLFGDRNQGSVEVEYDFSLDIVARFQFTKATVNNVDIVAGGINAEWAINPQFAVFGRFAIGHYSGFNPLLNQDLDLHPKSWSAGFIARRIFIPGSTAGVAIGQPFVTRDLGNATQTNLEAFYSFLLNDNISVTPALTVVNSPNNRDRGTIFEWFLRLVYSF